MTPERQQLEDEVEFMFMQLLNKLLLQGRYVNDKNRGNFAPTVFAKEPEAKKANMGKAVFEQALIRLFAKGKVRVAEEGPGGKRKRWLEPT